MKKTITLKKNYEFRRIFSKGKYFSGKYIEAFIRYNNNLNINLLGIAVGVKIAKAVKRNRIKRLIRENYRLLENNLNVGNDIIFLWKKNVDIKLANFENIRHDMINIFKKANIYKECD